MAYAEEPDNMPAELLDLYLALSNLSLTLDYLNILKI